MNDDELLDAVAADFRRRDAQRPTEWDDVTHGRTSVEAAMQARREAGDSDEAALERASELFTPLGPAFREALTDRLLETLQAPPAPESEPMREVATAAGSRSDAGADTAPTPHTVVRPDPKVWRRRTIAGVVAAAAAGLALWWTRPPAPTGGSDPARVATALPGYAAEVHAGVAQMRSGSADAAAATRVHPGDDVSILLRPAQRHSAPARATICLASADGTVVLASDQSPGAPGETLDVRARLPPSLPPGPATLVAIVSTEALGASPCATTDGDAHRVVRHELDVVAR